MFIVDNKHARRIKLLDCAYPTMENDIVRQENSQKKANQINSYQFFILFTFSW